MTRVILLLSALSALACASVPSGKLCIERPQDRPDILACAYEGATCVYCVDQAAKRTPCPAAQP